MGHPTPSFILSPNYIVRLAATAFGLEKRGVHGGLEKVQFTILVQVGPNLPLHYGGLPIPVLPLSLRYQVRLRKPEMSNFAVPSKQQPETRL